ncbi:MAG TPA: DUF1638 domain-containing protein, partial [Anaerolineae bacterium]
MRLKLISCEIFYREISHCIASSPNYIDLQFLPKGLHDIGSSGMLQRIQSTLDSVDESKYDAVVFGYALCNNGLAGLTARSLPIIVPRAHDCITLFLGNKDRYLDYFNSHLGTYFKTSGWIERGTTAGELSQLSVQRQIGMDKSYDELVEKYGEENARYLYDTLYGYKNYSQFTYIHMGIEPGDLFEQQTRAEAEEKGWSYEKVQGDISMLQRLVDGQWDNKEFLTVPPGHRIVTTFGPDIIG